MQTSWLSLCTDWEIPLWVTCALAVAGFVYLRGWLALRRTRPETLPVWRLLSFLAGLSSLFVAVSSPLDTYSETLLFMHMMQHFVLMSVAPPLIVLGCPSVPILRGLPRLIVSRIGAPVLRSSVTHRVQRLSSQLPCAWLAMNLTYLGWHIPKAYEFALASEGWHNLEHLCFFSTSVLFWWPILQPWPSRRRLNSWMIIPYLLASDLVNTGLSAFLCLSGRLLYPSYALVQRPFGLDALKDQSAAGAFMWVFGSLVFFVPAMYFTARFLTIGRHLYEGTRPESSRAIAR